MTTLKKLPLGIQSFAELIEKGYLYVDKTDFIHRLVTTGKLYFLSRPRRFGKSVLLSTLEALYRGQRQLFEGLYIADRWDWEPRPVIRLDFLGIESSGREILEHDLSLRLQEQARLNDLELKTQGCANQFRELILALAESGQVVVLIDEYDKPILDNITDADQAEDNRKFLANFYAVLKSVESKLDFLILTGVSRFTPSLFSELNNLTDITLHPNYAGIAGYSEAEVTQYLDPYLEQGIGGLSGVPLRNEIREWYNGYSWDGQTRMYNPVSLLNLLDQKRFSAFWFSTGTPKFLIELLRKSKISIPELAQLEIRELSMEGFEPKKIDPIALLFQTGYLTIRSVYQVRRRTRYLMGYPNLEVRESFLTHLLANCSENQPGQVGILAERIGEDLKEADIDGFCQGLQSLFGAIPYNIFINDREAYYHTVIYLVLSLTGLQLSCEIQTNRGRIDAVLETEDRFYVTEFKLGSAQEALDQIHDKQYAVAYRNRGKTVYLFGIGIDPQKRNLSEWICIPDEPAP